MARRAFGGLGETRYDADGQLFPRAVGAGPENRGIMEPTWHDGLSRKALVELVEGLLMAVDKSVPRMDAIAHHLSLMSQQGEEHEVLGGIADQVADIADELHTTSDRDRLRDWGNDIDAPEKAH